MSDAAVGVVGAVAAAVRVREAAAAVVRIHEGVIGDAAAVGQAAEVREALGFHAQPAVYVRSRGKTCLLASA